MGFFFTLAINFDSLESAQLCKTEITNSSFSLSDGTPVETSLNILKNPRLNKFQIEVYPQGLQYVTGDIKKCSPKFFYEIRKLLYSFLNTTPSVFNHAFF
jgi:hypothetical protein